VTPIVNHNVLCTDRIEDDLMRFGKTALRSKLWIRGSYKLRRASECEQVAAIEWMKSFRYHVYALDRRNDRVERQSWSARATIRKADGIPGTTITYRLLGKRDNNKARNLAQNAGACPITAIRLRVERSEMTFNRCLSGCKYSIFKLKISTTVYCEDLLFS